MTSHVRTLPLHHGIRVQPSGQAVYHQCEPHQMVLYWQGFLQPPELGRCSRSSLLLLLLTIGRYDPEGILKITDNTKWIRTISRCSQRQVNCREVIWHWNVARTPSIFETESSFLWSPPCAQKFSYRDHTGAGELMCWVRRVCQWRPVQKYNDHQDQRSSVLLLLLFFYPRYLWSRGILEKN